VIAGTVAGGCKPVHSDVIDVRTRKPVPPVVALGTLWRGELASPCPSISLFGDLTIRAKEERTGSTYTHLRKHPGPSYGLQSIRFKTQNRWMIRLLLLSLFVVAFNWVPTSQAAAAVDSKKVTLVFANDFSKGLAKGWRVQHGDWQAADGKSIVLKASHPSFHVPTPTLVFRCLGEGVEINDLQVWNLKK
jgi:hypothetical protein